MSARTHRVQVFVSARMKELARERRVAKEALAALEVDGWVFEQDAGAQPITIRQTYLDALDRADLYVGLFWKGYGEYTVEEFRYAHTTLGKDCLIYEKQAGDGEREEQLQRFLDELGDVSTGLTVRRFAHPEELAGYLREDVAGWQARQIHTAVVRDRAGRPFQAPPLADTFIERPLVAAELIERLHPDAGAKRRAVLWGPPGVGKTVMASAFAQIADDAGAFPDGVLWTSLGEEPDLLRSVATWGRALCGPSPPERGYPDVDTAVASLRSCLRDRACLLVVDDVWSAAHLERAYLVGGPRCLLLATARDSRIASAIGAESIELAPMREDEALELMSRWSGPVAEDDAATARELARAVGRIPLALELIGARVQRLASWDEYAMRRRRQPLDALTRDRGARGRRDNVRDSLDLSIRLLSPEDRRSYVALGVFPRKSAFPASAAATLWGCDPWEAAELLGDFAAQALLAKRGSRFGFHDLLYDAVSERLGEDAASRHEALLAAYLDGRHGWASLEDDGYIFDHLSYHLLRAGRRHELVELLTGSPDWLVLKAGALGADSSLAADVDRALAAPDLELADAIALHAVKRVVYERLGALDDTQLRTLVWRGRAEAALGNARLRPAPDARGDSLLAIYEELALMGETRTHLLDEALEVASAIPEGAARSAALLRLGLMLAAASDHRWVAALDASRDAGCAAERVSARCRALLALADAVRDLDPERSELAFDHAWTCALEMPGNDDVDEVLEELALAQATHGRARDALAVLDGLPARSWRLDDILARVLVALSRAGVLTTDVVDDVARLLDDADDARSATLARALAGDAGAAAELLADEDAERLTRYASMLRRCRAAELAAAGDLEGARHELRAIRSRTAHADALTDVVRLAPASDAQEVAALVVEQAPAHLPGKRDVIVQDEVIAATLRAWRLLVHVGRPEEMLELIARLGEHERMLALEALLPELDAVDAGNRGALLSRADPLAHGIELRYRRVRALRALALAYAKIGDERSDAIAAELAVTASAEGLPHPGLVRDVAEVFLADGLIQTGRAILTASRSIDGLCALAWFLYRGKDMRYEQVVEQVLDDTSSLDNDEARAHAHVSVAELLLNMDDERWRTSSASARELARSALTKRERIGLDLLPYRTASEVLARLVDALCAASRLDDALDVLLEILDPAHRAQRAAHVAMRLDRAGDPRGGELFAAARKNLDDLHLPGVYAAAARTLVLALTEADRLDEANEVIATMERSDHRNQTTVAIFAGTLITAGRPEEAQRLARTLDDPRLRAEVLVDAALAQPDGARELLHEVGAIAETAATPDRRASVLAELVRGLVGTGRLADAEAVAPTIPQQDFRAAALRGIADALREALPARADELLRATRLEAASIPNAYQREDFIRTLADREARAHGVRRGLEVLRAESVDDFVGAIAGWAPLIRQEGADASAALRGVIAVAAWFRTDWRAVAACLTNPEASG
jgi:hypothetical protein